MLPRPYKTSAESSRHDVTLAAFGEIPPFLAQLTDRMVSQSYREMEVFEVRLAVEEAIINAIRHGHQGDPAQSVHVSCLVTDQHVLIRVQDQGSGFDPYQIPDPLDPENLGCESGRGIFLMKAAMTWVKFNASGNCVTLCKKRSR